MTTKRPSHTRYLKIHDDVWGALKREAERDHRTVTNLVQKILGKWVAQKEALATLKKGFEEEKKEEDHRTVRKLMQKILAERVKGKEGKK